MYFLYNKSFNAFYGVSGAWVPKEVAKKAPDKICIFGDSYEAQTCKSQEGFKSTVMILNEKSMRNKMKIKQFPSSMQPNWNRDRQLSVKDAANTQENDVANESVLDEEANQFLSNDPLDQICEEAEERGDTPDFESKQAMNVETGSNSSKKMTYCEYLEQFDSDTVLENGDRMYLQSTLPKNILNTKLIQETMEYLTATRHILSVWETRMRSIDTEIHHCDLQISDELHLLELISDLSDVDMLNCSKRLQAIRRSRRLAKNERDLGHLVIPMLRTGVDFDKLNAIEKFINDIQSRVYRVRQPDAEVDIPVSDEEDFGPEIPLSIRSPETDGLFSEFKEEQKEGS